MLVLEKKCPLKSTDDFPAENVLAKRFCKHNIKL